MKNISCPKCGGPTIRGVRLGNLSFGDFFIEHGGERRTSTEARKPKPGAQRVVSVACRQCGLVSSFLEGVIRDEMKS
jgi:hypothetical protein